SKRRCRTAAEATSETFRCEISGPRLGSALERLTGDGMNRDGLVVSLGLAAGLAPVLSAQGPSSNGNGGQKPKQSINVKVIVCVGGGSEAGHYRLTNASLSGDDVPSTVGTVGTAGSGQDVSFGNSLSYDSSVAISRHTWATRSKSSASPVTRN